MVKKQYPNNQFFFGRMAKLEKKNAATSNVDGNANKDIDVGDAEVLVKLITLNFVIQTSVMCLKWITFID